MSTAQWWRAVYVGTAHAWRGPPACHLAGGLWRQRAGRRWRDVWWPWAATRALCSVTTAVMSRWRAARWRGRSLREPSGCSLPGVPRGSALPTNLWRAVATVTSVCDNVMARPASADPAARLPSPHPGWPAMYDTFQNWALQNYGDAGKTKTVTRKKYTRISRILTGEETPSSDNSKFRFWVKAKGFRLGPPPPEDTSGQDQVLYVPSRVQVSFGSVRAPSWGPRLLGLITGYLATAAARGTTAARGPPGARWRAGDGTDNLRRGKLWPWTRGCMRIATVYLMLIFYDVLFYQWSITRFWWQFED